MSNAKEVVTPEGLRYTDLKLGGGSPPVPGASSQPHPCVLQAVSAALFPLFEDEIRLALSLC